MNEVRFSEQNRLEGQGWLAGNACSSEPLPCTGMSRRAGQNKRQASYSPAFSLWRMRMIETA